MDDHALYGYSLFETLLAKRGRFWRPEAHYRRLVEGAEFFEIPVTSQKNFFDLLMERHDPRKIQVLRYTLFKEGGRWSSFPDHGLRGRALVLAADYQPDSLKHWRLGRAGYSLGERDPIRGFKCGARIAYQAEFDRARAKGFQDALFYDHSDRILEGSTCNLFFLRGDTWWTPPVSAGLLPGVTRAWMLESKEVRESELLLEDLDSVRAVIATNSVRGLVPVEAIDDHQFDTDLAEQFIENKGQRDFSLTRVRQ